MKIRILIATLLMISLLAGCNQPGADANTDAANTPNTTNSGSVQSQPKPQEPAQTGQTDMLIPEEEAKNIALQHAGFTADQVTGLRIDFDYDDGIPEYDVYFREGFLEYEYEIHAKTGQILSWEKDD